MKAVLVLSGTSPPAELDAELAGAFVVAVDGGGNALAERKIVPHAVVGDMDSIRPENLAAFAAAGAEIHRHPSAKLHTDAQLALDLVLQRGADEIVFSGATGRRLDMTLANFHLLARAARGGTRVRAVEAGGRAWVVTRRSPLRLAIPQGTLVSILALTPRATGVTLSGLAYPLRGATMVPNDPYGLSNVATGDGPVGVRCRSGVLVTVVPVSSDVNPPP